MLSRSPQPWFGPVHDKLDKVLSVGRTEESLGISEIQAQSTYYQVEKSQTTPTSKKAKQGCFKQSLLQSFHIPGPRSHSKMCPAWVNEEAEEPERAARPCGAFWAQQRLFRFTPHLVLWLPQQSLPQAAAGSFLCCTRCYKFFLLTRTAHTQLPRGLCPEPHLPSGSRARPPQLLSYFPAY